MPEGRAKKGKGSKDDKHAAETAMQASMRGVIVLEQPTRTDKQQCQHCEPVSKEAGLETESSDPVVLRRIVRRQAALASANTRKATIAAGRSKKPGTPSNASAPFVATKKVGRSPWRALLDRTGLQQMDPFSQLPVDFDAVRDPSTLHSLFDYFMAVVAPLIDLRLPTMADQIAGTKFLWSEELPYCALRSPSCFWAMMLGANSQMNNAQGIDASKDHLTLTFRHMTIKSINLRLPQMQEDCPDWGLMSSIAILGCWEKFHGNESAWRAHREGLKVFSQQLRNEHLRNEVFAQILTFVDTDNALMPDLLGIEMWQTILPSDGFAKLAQLTYINTNLVISLRNCRAVELAETEEHRQRVLDDATAGVFLFAVRHYIGEVACTDPFRDREGDRQTLTVHVIMQMAGMTMAQYLANGKRRPIGVAKVDFPTMCHDAARLISSVMHAVMYNEVLLWAAFTIGALTVELVEPLVFIASELSRRLKLEGSHDWQPVLRQFVLLESAGERYEFFSDRVREASQLSQGPVLSHDCRSYPSALGPSTSGSPFRRIRLLTPRDLVVDCLRNEDRAQQLTANVRCEHSRRV